MQNLKNFIIVCGHYGCGKTNLSLNLAIDRAKKGEKVTIVDLDLVNPYFRTSEYQELLNDYSIKLISPVYANSTLDLPALPAELYSIFVEPSDCVILDVGGDDAGATVLGRISSNISKIDYDMIYVVNAYRALTTKPEEAVELLGEIETASRLKATAVVNNSHLKQLTTAEDILQSTAFAKSVAEKLKLPLLFTTAPQKLSSVLFSKVENLYPVHIYVRSPWEKN